MRPPAPPSPEQQSSDELARLRVAELERSLGEAQLFRALSEQHGDAVWQESWEGALLYASPAGETTFGRSREHLFDRPRAWLEAIHPGGRAALERLLGQVRSRPAPAIVPELRILRPDGSVATVQALILPLAGAHGGVAYALRDVARPAEAERQRLKRVLDGLFAFVALSSLDGVLVEANRAPPRGGRGPTRRGGGSTTTELSRRSRERSSTPGGTSSPSPSAGPRRWSAAKRSRSTWSSSTCGCRA